MNEIIKALQERRSCRSFKPEMPRKEDISEIIEAGLYAANAKGIQSPVTIAVTNQELREKIVKINCQIGGWQEGFDPFYGAPVILIVVAPKDWGVNGIADGSLVIGNMLLAAHALGLGSIWINRAREEFELPEYQQLLHDLGLEGEWQGIGHCAIGYANSTVPAVPRRDGRVVWVE